MSDEAGRWKTPSGLEMHKITFYGYVCVPADWDDAFIRQVAAKGPAWVPPMRQVGPNDAPYQRFPCRACADRVHVRFDA